METLVTLVILVIVFALLAIIFGRVTTLHRVIRGGGSAEQLGAYWFNTILYGPGIDRHQGLVGAIEVSDPATTTTSDTLSFTTPEGNTVEYTIDEADGVLSLLYGGSTGPDLMPGWARDQQLELVEDSVEGSGFRLETGDDLVVVIRFEIRDWQRPEGESVELERRVRIRNQLPANAF